jgi:hypothetical protein
MSRKRNTRHPNFIIGAVSYLFLLVGVVFFANGMEVGKALVLTAVLLGGIHWIGSIIDVWTDKQLKQESDSRYFWLALVIMIPPIAGVLYYIMRQKKISI